MAGGPRLIKAALAAGRVSNLPSVVSNAFTGWVLAHLASGGGGVVEVGWGSLSGMIPVGVAACGLYLFGCFLNNWWDQPWDREHRPERLTGPLALSRRQLGFLAVGSFALGLGGLVVVGRGQVWLVAFALVVSIVLYTFGHKQVGWAVVPMALCRALLYPLGFAAACPIVFPVSPVLIFGSGVMFAYILGVSLFARGEAGSERRRRWVGRLLSLIPMVDVLVLLVGVCLWRCSWGVGLGWLVVPVVALVGAFVLRRWVPAT